jgi:predicted aspartyl protease
MPRLPGILIAAALASLIGGCARSSGPADAQACVVGKAAEIPISTAFGFVSAPATINDRPATLLVDTGSERSLVTPAAMGSYHLREDPHRTTTIQGIGGGFTAHDAVLKSFGIGGLELLDQRASVGALPTARGISVQADGLLGADWLRDFDVEIDLPHKVMSLYRVTGCSGDYLPWAGAKTSVIAQVYRQGLILLPVEIDGHPVTAVLDRGANGSLITEAAAERFGLEASALTRDGSGRSSGVDGAVTPTHRHQFAQMKIGGAVYATPTLSVGAVRLPVGDMLLGADWMRRNRVWVSYATRHVFFQPAAPSAL